MKKIIKFIITFSLCIICIFIAKLFDYSGISFILGSIYGALNVLLCQITNISIED